MAQVKEFLLNIFGELPEYQFNDWSVSSDGDKLLLKSGDNVIEEGVSRDDWNRLIFDFLYHVFSESELPGDLITEYRGVSNKWMQFMVIEEYSSHPELVVTYSKNNDIRLVIGLNIWDLKITLWNHINWLINDYK